MHLGISLWHRARWRRVLRDANPIHVISKCTRSLSAFCNKAELRPHPAANKESIRMVFSHECENDTMPSLHVRLNCATRQIDIYPSARFSHYRRTRVFFLSAVEFVFCIFIYSAWETFCCCKRKVVRYYKPRCGSPKDTRLLDTQQREREVGLLLLRVCGLLHKYTLFCLNIHPAVTWTWFSARRFHSSPCVCVWVFDLSVPIVTDLFIIITLTIKIIPAKRARAYSESSRQYYAGQ